LSASPNRFWQDQLQPTPAEPIEGQAQPVEVFLLAVDHVADYLGFETQGDHKTRRDSESADVRRRPALWDLLDDNSEHDDVYRYHDVFHLAHMTVLGWSPMMRALLHRKLSGMPAVDRIQDGGRAIAIEEGLTAHVSTMAAQLLH
jgi:hypothetical protein